MDVTRKIDLIVIHCSATPNGQWRTAADIDRMHGERKPPFMRNPRLIGFNQPTLKHIGYHFVVYTTGAVATGRGLAEIGAHVQGHNANSVGICMIGTDHYTREQWQAVAELVAGLRKQFPDARICGHRDLSPDTNHNGKIEQWEWLKTCPGFDVAAWLRGGMQPPKTNLLEPAP